MSRRVKINWTLSKVDLNRTCFLYYYIFFVFGKSNFTYLLHFSWSYLLHFSLSHLLHCSWFTCCIKNKKNRCSILVIVQIKHYYVVTISKTSTEQNIRIKNMKLSQRDNGHGRKGFAINEKKGKWNNMSNTLKMAVSNAHLHNTRTDLDSKGMCSNRSSIRFVMQKECLSAKISFQNYSKKLCTSTVNNKS